MSGHTQMSKNKIKIVINDIHIVLHKIMFKSIY